MFKLIKFLFKLIFFLLIILIVALGVFIVLLYDNNVSEPDYLINSETVEFDINALVSKGLENTKETKRIELVLTDEQMSIIRKSTAKKINDSASGFGFNIKTAYVSVTDIRTIKFNSYISFMGFNSSLKGDFDYELVNDELIFHISKVSVGKINLETKLINSLKIDKESLNKMFAENLINSGVSVTINDSNVTVSISLDTFKDMLLSDMIKESEDMDLHHTLLSLILRNSDLIQATNSLEGIGVDIDLDKLDFDSNTDASIPYTIDFDSVSDKVEQLLDNNIISSDNANLVATYLVKGYEKLSEDKQKEVDKINLSTIGITDNSSYLGIIEYEKYTIIDVFTNQYTGVFSGLKLTEKNWNEILLQNDLVGEMYCFIRKEDDKHYISYISVESIYVDIKEDHLSFYLTLSANGESLLLNLDLNHKDTNGLKVTFDINAVRFGSVALNDDEISSLLTYMSNTIDEEWIIVNSEAKEVVIDFIGVFENNSVLSLILQMPGVNPTAKFTEDKTGGYVLIE